MVFGPEPLVLPTTKACNLASKVGSGWTGGYRL
jgi:hypothetical protein